MKISISFMVMLVMLNVLTACNSSSKPEVPLSGGDGYYNHYLFLSFMDTSGKDLVKGIGFNYEVSDGVIIIGGEDETGGVVKPELYSLEYVYEDGIPNPWNPPPAPLINGFPAYMLDKRYPEISLFRGKTFNFSGLTEAEYPEINKDYDYLYFNTISYLYTGLPEMLLYGKKIEYCDFAKKIIIKLKCPYLFGDEEVHEIVTWWEPHKDAPKDYAICYRIEFGGKKYTEIIHTKYSALSVATLVLDR